nr:MAG TPA: hypothetical protein [Caudoviricetes sp.]
MSILFLNFFIFFHIMCFMFTFHILCGIICLLGGVYYDW